MNGLPGRYGEQALGNSTNLTYALHDCMSGILSFYFKAGRTDNAVCF